MWKICLLSNPKLERLWEMTGIIIIHVDYSTSQFQNFAISFARLSNPTNSKYCYPCHDFPNPQFQNFTNPPYGVFLDIGLIIPLIIFSGERQKLHVNYNYYFSTITFLVSQNVIFIICFMPRAGVNRNTAPSTFAYQV